MNAMYSVEQVNVPPELGTIMKQYTKAVLRDQPENVYKYSANFFAVLSGQPAPFDQDGQLTGQNGGAPATKQRHFDRVSAPVAAAATPQEPRTQSSSAADEEPKLAEDAYEERGEGGEDGFEREGTDMSDEDVVRAIFQKYAVGEDGVTTVDVLPELLADLRDALALSEEDLPPAEEIAALLNCDDGSVDLLELKQLLFESEEA